MRDREILRLEAAGALHAARRAKRAALAEPDKIASVSVDWATGEITIVRYVGKVLAFKRQGRP